MSIYTSEVREKLAKISLLTSIIAIKPSPVDLKNVFSWIELEKAENIHFVLVLDRPSEIMLLMCKEFIEQRKQLQAQVTFEYGDYFGPAEARNAGIPYISSNYVAFWDSDDSPAIHQIVDYLSNHKMKPSHLIVGSFEILIPGKKRRVLKTSNLVQLARNPGLWRCLISVDLVKNSKFSDIILGEDQVYLANLIANVNEIEFTSNVFYSYKFGGSNQLTSTKDFSDLLEAESLINQINLSEVEKPQKKFVNNISTKQLLTLLIRGKFKLKLISLSRLFRKLLLNLPTNVISIKEMISTPSEERFNG